MNNVERSTYNFLIVIDEQNYEVDLYFVIEENSEEKFADLCNLLERYIK
jgi:hypothetical protein